MENRLLYEHSLPGRGEILLRRLLTALLACFSLASLGYSGLKILRLQPNLALLTVVAVAALSLGACILLYRVLQKASGLIISLVIFGVALLPRVLFSLLAAYAPVSDFAFYHQFALWLQEGNRQAVYDTVVHYQIGEFAGLAALNYGLSLLFTSSVAGMQLASHVLSALTCVVVYHLAAPYNKKAGLLAALAYAFYPGGIVAVQQLTNQVGATLFALLALLVLLRAIPSRGYWRFPLHMAGSAALLVVSHYFHPSSIITQIAVLCFLGTLMLRSRKKGEVLRLGSGALAFLLAFSLLLSGGNALLEGQGLLPDNLSAQQSVLPRSIVMGLNPNTNGAYSLEDVEAIKAQPPENQVAYCLNLIAQRVSQPLPLLKTLVMKTFNMWVRTDNVFINYALGVEEGPDGGTPRAERALAFAQALQLWDLLFVMLLYGGAALGLVLALRGKGPLVACLLLWVVLGWVGVYVFIEAQPRYRFYAMPMLAVFFGIGVDFLLTRKKRAGHGLAASKES